MEDAYSDALAWLFTPWESHGLGTAFLKSVIERWPWSGTPPNWNVISVNIRTKAGKGFVDIEVQGQEWRLVIENKICADEGPDQTADYTKHYEQEQFGRIGESIFLILLTPDGRKPNSPHSRFLPFSYRKLRESLEDLHPSTLAAEVVVQHMIQQIIKELE